MILSNGTWVRVDVTATHLDIVNASSDLFYIVVLSCQCLQPHC